MPITVVDRQLHDSSHAASPFSTKADSSCYQSTVKIREAALIFSISVSIMTNTWKNFVDVFDQLRELPDFLWRSQWLCDETLASYISNNSSDAPAITYNELNSALRKSELYKMNFQSESINNIGVHFHKRKVNNRTVSFYYISKDKNDVPVRPTDKDEWLKYFNENHIVRSTRKRAYEPSEPIRVETPVPSEDDEIISPSHAELHDKVREKSGSFWKDKKIEKLFNSSDVEGSLNEWINQLKVAKFDMSALKDIVNKSDKSPLEMHHIPLMQIKVMYLR